MAKQAPKVGRRAVLWDVEEREFVQREDTRRVLHRGGLKFVGYTEEGLEYRVIKSKTIGGHTVHKSKALGFYKRVSKD